VGKFVLNFNDTKENAITVEALEVSKLTKTIRVLVSESGQ
jgi:hypothetical protein